MLADRLRMAVAAVKELYLYKEGEEFVALTGGWVAGFSGGGGSISKEADHLYLTATYSIARGHRTYVTDDLIDLTGFDKLYVEWESTNYANNNNQNYLIASTNKTADQNTYNARYERLHNFAKRTDELDISGLSGDHYVRAHQRNNHGDWHTHPRLYVYNIWLE